MPAIPGREVPGVEIMIERVIIIVLDSVGAGELPDAANYGDSGSNTLANTAAAVGGLKLPNLAAIGLGNIISIAGLSRIEKAQGAYGKLAEVSPGKDSTTGHWELMGVQLEKEFPLYPEGFPDDIINRFETLIHRRILGNKVASGTEIIKELGAAHLRTGRPIVYTSADSVFQIAAHQDIIPLKELYQICQTARDILTGNNSVGRVIARPFTGAPGGFTRTEWRRDFSLPPPAKTVLDYAQAAGIPVRAIGKISELFAGRGISSSVHSGSNMEGIDQILAHLEKFKSGIIFANLVDFDMLWGHRNNAKAYADGLAAVDRRLPEILARLTDRDILIITADHGCDPTTPSTDHSREYVPLLVVGVKIRSGINLETRPTFADVGKTVAAAMGFKALVKGSSFWPQVEKIS